MTLVAFITVFGFYYEECREKNMHTLKLVWTVHTSVFQVRTNLYSQFLLYKIQTKYYKKNLNWLFKVSQINQILTSSKLSNLSQARAKAQGCQDEHSKQCPTALSTLLNNSTL